MDRIWNAAAYVALAFCGAALAATWTALVLLFMYWPLHSLAVLAVLVAASMAKVEAHRRRGRLAAPAVTVDPGVPPTAEPLRSELVDLIEVLGEETYLELSQVAIDISNE